MSDWQPIETAPENTVVILPGGIGHRHDGVWKTLTGERYPGQELTWTPKVWMPLPEFDESHWIPPMVESGRNED